MHIEEALGFNDVMLRPKFSDIRSRSEVSLEVELTKGFKTSMPIIPSNMKTIISPEVIEYFYQQKAIVIMHRFCPFDEQISLAKSLQEKYGNDVFNYVGFSVGVKKEDYDNVDVLIKSGVKIILIDVAHGHHILCIEMTQYIAKRYPEVLLISGNTATYEGAMSLYDSGADIVKCNIGSGSICTTRVMTGNGMPQISTLDETSQAKFDYNLSKDAKEYNGKKVFILSDGGAASPGDVAKGLCFADLVMTGNLVAGCDECPGDIMLVNGEKYKAYDGSSTHRGNYTEGVRATVKAKGPIENVIQSIKEGLQSACSYQGVRKVQNLQDDPQFVKISAAGLKESQAHDVFVVR